MKVLSVALLLLATMSIAMAQGDLIDKLEELGNTQLLAYLDSVGLTDALRVLGPFTIFAPSDAAIDKLDDDIKAILEFSPDILAQVLTFHVSPGEVFSSDLENEQLVPTLEGSNNRINIYGSTVTATGAPISIVDQEASNGVIHVIDSMIVPLPVASLFEEMVEDPDFSTLATLVALADLRGVLAAPGALTLFAPSNDAFDKVPDEVLEDLIQNPEKLREVLLYHVVDGTQFSAGLSTGTYETLQGQDISITVNEDGSVGVNDAVVEFADVATITGVGHTIDTVLLPELA